MSSIESQFDQLFKCKGGRHSDQHSHIINYNWILISSRNLITWMRQNEAYLPEPYIDIVDNNGPNAFATKNDNKYFIGITYGAIVLFNDVFHRMYSSKIFLADVGYPTSEIDANEIFFIRLTHMAQLALPEKRDERSPINDTRFLLSFQLMKMAFEFLILHEFAHIIYGHLGFVHSVLGSFDMKEVEEKLEKRRWIDPLVSQTLEINADSYAAIRGMDILEILISNPNILAPELRPYFNDWPSALKMWIYSIYTFFRLFSNQNSDKRMGKAFYPPPSIRSHLVLSYAISALKNRNNVPTPENLSKICMNAIADIERVFEDISQKGMDLTHLSFFVHEKASAHALFLMKNYENVMPLLQPFTYSLLIN